METLGKILLWICLIPIIIVAVRYLFTASITALIGLFVTLNPDVDSDERIYGVVALVIGAIIVICAIALLMAIF